ncbi:hypothetical protein ACFSUS_24480 [Spirosoma soli]|uniref:DUF1080 domain-containing protein n=1 Tax=Spirosoma soli TaxID=1770529 RepID=A0ABW5MCH1_9BACT
MRPYVLITLITLLAVNSFAQSSARRQKPVIFSASSDWQKVTLKPTARLQPSRPTSAATNPADANTSPAPTVTVPPAQPDRTAPAEVVSTAPPSPYANRPSAPPVSPNETVTQPTRTGSSGASTSDFRPAFTGDFATNRNGWKAGIKGDYHFQIGMGRYSIRKRNVNTQQVAFSYVSLPPDINLNNADLFTIKVDVMADSGRIPTGGLVFGVRDSLNFNAFTLNGKGEISIIRVANGQVFSDYMPGDFFSPGVPIDKNRNRLTIRRKDGGLYFYVNEREVRTSPYPFRTLSGNGIGMITSGYWTSFQKLSVTLGP